MTDVETVALLKVIQSAYRNVEFGEETIKVYAFMLSDLPYKVAEQAVVKLIAGNKFPPTIAEIRRECAEAVDPLPSAEEAWIEVINAAREMTLYPTSPALQIELRGYVKDETYMSPLARKAVQVMGGLESIAFSDQREFSGREFRRVYERLRESAVIARQQQVMPGRQLKALAGGDRHENLHNRL